MSERQPWSDYERLKPDTHRLIRHVEEQTGRVVEIQPERAIRERGRAIFVVTDPNPDRHLILYDPDLRRFLDHLVAHECGHILRFAEAEPQDRVVPIMTAERRLRAARQLLPELVPLVQAGLPARAIEEVLPVWLSGTVAQLSDTPSDVHIEAAIYRDYPGLRKVQEASLLDQFKMLHLVTNRAVAAVTPPSIWLASNAMNYVLVKSVAEFIDRPGLTIPYRNTRAQILGEQLLAISRAAGDSDLRTDRNVSRQWADLLGFGDWLEWRRLDQLPQGFRHAWE